MKTYFLFGFLSLLSVIGFISLKFGLNSISTLPAFAISQAEQNDLFLHFVKYSKYPFKNVYAINLERRKDRREHMKEELEKASLTYEFFNGIDGKFLNQTNVTNSSFPFLERIHPNTKFNFSKAGSILGPRSSHYGIVGCWQSHLQVYFKICEIAKKTQQDGPVLILEDDSMLSPYFVQRVNRLLLTLPDNWDIFFVGTTNHLCTNSTFGQVCELKWVVGATAYIVNGAKTAKKLVDISNTAFVQISDVLWLPYINGPLHFYAISSNKRENHLSKPDHYTSRKTDIQFHRIVLNDG